MISRNIELEIGKFINSISDLWKDEALDCDDCQEIADIVKTELDWQNGNISKDEYKQA